MKLKNIFITAVSVLLMLSMSVVPVFADTTVETDSGEVVVLPSYDWNAMIEESPELDTETFKCFTRLYDATAYGKLKYDVPSSELQVSRLNFDYEMLCISMDNMGFGTKYQIEVPEFKAGYASSLTQEFSNTFGDLSSKAVTEMSMPEGWSVSNIMKNASSQREQVVSDYKNSQAYQAMYNSINSNAIFKVANQTMTMPQTSSISSLAGKLSSVGSPYNINGEISNAKDNYLYNEYVADSNHGADALSSKFDTTVDNISDLINNNYSGAYELMVNNVGQSMNADAITTMILQEAENRGKITGVLDLIGN